MGLVECCCVAFHNGRFFELCLSDIIQFSCRLYRLAKAAQLLGNLWAHQKLQFFAFVSVSVAYPKVEQHNLTLAIKFRNSACGPRCWCLQIMCNTVLLWWWRNVTQMVTNLGLTIPVEITSKLNDYIIAVLCSDPLNYRFLSWVEVSLFHFDNTNPQHPLVPSWTSV